MSANWLDCLMSRLEAYCVICAALRRSGFCKQSTWAIKSDTLWIKSTRSTRTYSA